MHKEKTTKQKKKRQKADIRKRPGTVALLLIIVYFLLDMVMMDVREEPPAILTVIATLWAPVSLFVYYAMDYQQPFGGTDTPAFVENKQRYVRIGWLVIAIYGILFLIAEPFLVPKFFPTVDSTYYRSQVTVMLYIAPIIEELIYRYFLYDRWLRRQWGWFWGFLAVSLIFVLGHPVANLHSFVIYWIPTVMFFLIYQQFGLYGSILIHMLYNMMAI